MDWQRPTIGRIVHFKAHATPDGIRAAIITSVHSDTEADLTVFTPTGQFYSRSLYDGTETPKVGTWHWPPRT